MRSCPGAPGVVVHQRARRHWGRARGSSDVDEVLETAEPVVMRLGGGAVAEKLRSHEQRSVWAGRWTPMSRGTLVPGRMRGHRVLVALVVDVLVAVVIVVVGVLHTWIHGVAPRSVVGARTAARPGGVDDGLGLSPA
jgi:hypothetical protein